MIKIHYLPGHLGWAVYEYRLGANGYRENKTSDGAWVVAKPGTEHQPTMFIEDLEEWAVAIRDAGVKLPSDHKLEGVLEAQKLHLADMRSLVFKRGRGAASPAHNKSGTLTGEKV